CAGVKEGSVGGTGGTGGSSCRPGPCADPIGTSVVLAVEVDPPGSSGAGVTELPSQDLNQSKGSLSLRAEPLLAITATFNASSNATVPTNANILLDLPSLIPGRPDLTFQASASPGGAPSASAAQLSVPQ